MRKTGDLGCLLSAGLLLGASLTTGCIKEGLPPCPVKGVDLFVALGQQEGSAPYGPVDEATLYLFDRDGRYAAHVPVPQTAIGGAEPVHLDIDPAQVPWVVVWGNVKDRETISALDGSTTLEKSLIGLRSDVQGYEMIPDDLFYGIRRLSGETRDEVMLAPKTGRMHITVKGLSSVEEPWFTVESRFGGYFFTGRPQAKETLTRLPASYTESGDLATPGVCNMIHYPDAEDRTDAFSSAVKLWKTTPAGDELLAAVDRDASGSPIRPAAGRTTNILIRFTENGRIDVQVVLTDWAELYQWDEW